MRVRHEPKHVVEVVHGGKLESPATIRERKQQVMATRLRQIKIVDRVETNKDPQVTRDDILRSLDRWPKAILRVIGGDGSLNTATHALMLQDPAERSALSPSRTGSAKDFYFNHNSILAGLGPVHMQMYRALRRTPDTVYPMMLRIHQDDGETVTHYANNNFGFNYTARFAQLIDAPAYRKSRLKKIPVGGGVALDTVTLVRSLRGLDTYHSDDVVHGSLDLNDRSLIHAQKAGKHLRFPGDSHTQPRHFFDSHTAEPSVWGVLKTAVSMTAGKAGGTHTDYVGFVNGDRDVVGHKDGEYFNVPAGAFVEVTLGDSYQVYGTRPAHTVPDLLPPVA